MAPTTLLSLLPELLHHLTTHLTYASHFALSLTCKTLHARLDDPNQRPLIPPTAPSDGNATALPAKPYTMADLLDIELWYLRRIRGLPHHLLVPSECFSCCICLHLRTAIYFENKMMKGELGKYRGSYEDERWKRFCIPCGVERGTYRRGAEIEFGASWGGMGFVCLRCGMPTRGTGKDILEYGFRCCKVCWGPGECQEHISRYYKVKRCHGGCLPGNYYGS